MLQQWMNVLHTKLLIFSGIDGSGERGRRGIQVRRKAQLRGRLVMTAIL